MVCVGHKKLDTILRYAAKVSVRKEEPRKKAARPFAAFCQHRRLSQITGLMFDLICSFPE